LESVWKNENDWKVYDLLVNLLKALPANFKQPSDDAKNNILLHSFWKVLLDGNFSVFNSNKFIQLNFLLLNKYHSFQINEFLSFLNFHHSDSLVSNSTLSNNHYINIINSLETYSFLINEEEILYDNTISIDSWFELIISNIIFGNKKLSNSRKIKEIENVLNYFIKNKLLPSYLLDYVKVKQSIFFSFLLGYYNSLDKNKFIKFLNINIDSNNIPFFINDILINSKNKLSFDNSNLNLSTVNSTLDFENFNDFIKYFLNDNNDLSIDYKLINIEKFIFYFIEHLSFPKNYPGIIQNKQNLFFSILMEKLYSLSFNRFIEIISFSFFSSKPIWFKNIIRQLIKKLNINLSNFEVPDSDTKLLFENDDIFISTLLGFKPFSSVNNDIEKISNESFNLLIFILNNDKLPNKYESLSRYDFSFLVTILLRYIYAHNNDLFNQFLLKFSSFSDNSRNMLFNFFSGNSTHTIDLSISDNLIPLLNNEIDLQNFKSQNIVSNKISYNLNLKFNEWINNESLLGSLSREDKLFQLFNYFLSNGKLYDSFSFLSNSYLFEFLKMLIFELEKIDSKKMLSLLSRDNNDTLATNLVLNLFSKGFSIDERRIYSLFQSVVPKISYFDLLQDDLHEFDIQFIDLSVNNFPLKDLDFKDLFNNTKYHEKVNDQILIDNSISILIYFLINKKRDPKYKNISDNQFLIYLKEIVSFIFSKQLTFLRESFENPVYPLSNKLVVYSLFFQTYNSKDITIKLFLQPFIESQIFKYVESIVRFPISSINFKEGVNFIINSRLTIENINVLKLLQFVQSADLIDELPQLYLTELVSKNMGNSESAYLKQILLLFNSSLTNFQDKNELSNLFVRFNSFILSDLKSLVSLDIYLRRLIQFLIYQNRTRALYFFGKFLYFTQNINFSFSSEYFFIISKLRKLFNELINASVYLNLSDSHIINRDKPLLDKITEVVSEFNATESSKFEQGDTLTIPKEDYKDSDDSIYINNAGLVLFNPYITTFLSRLGMTEKGKFKDEDSAFRSVHLLQLLITEATYGEHELVLNKILCNLPISSSVPMDIELKPAEKLLAKELIEVTMKRWKKGSSGSKESFRASFINRDGRLSMINEEWHLKVDQRGYDVILQTLPWSYGMIKLPWMLKPLIVEWI